MSHPAVGGFLLSLHLTFPHQKHENIGTSHNCHYVNQKNI